MTTPLSQRQEISEHVEPPADICVPIGSAPSPSQSRGAPETFENIVNEHYYRPLLKAAFIGDWEFAKGIFQADPDTKTAYITSRRETALHVAALNAHEHFVENLIGLLFQSHNAHDALEKPDCDGRTALHIAVLGGEIQIVKALVARYPRLTQMKDHSGYVPLILSTEEAFMSKEIVWFLAEKTTFDLQNESSSDNVIRCIVGLIYGGYLDIVLYLLERYPSLILKKGPQETDKSILGALARTPSNFRSGTRLSVLTTLIYKCIPVDVNSRPMQTAKNLGGSFHIFGVPVQCLTWPLWKVAQFVGSFHIFGVPVQCLTWPLWKVAQFVVHPIKRIHDVKLRNETAMKLVKMVCEALYEKSRTEINDFFQHKSLLAQATARGINELVKLSIQSFPELIWHSDDETTLMTRAVQYRQDRIIRLFLKESSTNDLSVVTPPTKIESCYMMKAAAECYPESYDFTIVTGAAFQMQRELQWYMAMESWVSPEVRTARTDGKTYWEVFMEHHKKLLKNARSWVKDTADRGMLVSTLIATVLFTAAFSVPGTNNDSTITLLKGPYLAFAIFDGLGLLSSVAATLLFLAILVSPNEPLDFLDLLPRKIIMALFSLFLSLVFMLAAFAMTLTIVFGKTFERAVIPFALLISLPVALFIVLQHPLLFQMIKSTYGPSIFHPESIWN